MDLEIEKLTKLMEKIQKAEDDYDMVWMSHLDNLRTLRASKMALFNDLVENGLNQILKNIKERAKQIDDTELINEIASIGESINRKVRLASAIEDNNAKKIEYLGIDFNQLDII